MASGATAGVASGAELIRRVHEQAYRQLGHRLDESDNGTVLEIAHDLVMAELAKMPIKDIVNIAAVELTDRLLREAGIVKE
jgi:hypothetical protein